MAYYEAKWLGFNEPWQDSWPWRIWIASRSFHNVLNELDFFSFYFTGQILPRGLGQKAGVVYFTPRRGLKDVGQNPKASYWSRLNE